MASLAAPMDDRAALYARLMRALQPAMPVRAALYFPLLQQWREVPVHVGDDG